MTIGKLHVNESHIRNTDSIAFTIFQSESFFYALILFAFSSRNLILVLSSWLHLSIFQLDPLCKCLQPLRCLLKHKNNLLDNLLFFFLTAVSGFIGTKVSNCCSRPHRLSKVSRRSDFHLPHLGPQASDLFQSHLFAAEAH